MKFLALLPVLCLSAPAETYFVMWDGGLDTNNGLGKDASLGQPFKTIQKLVNTMVSGDIGYVCVGTQREVVTLATAAAWTSKTRIVGDPQNAQGFKNVSGVLVTKGFVRWTGYTTDDTTTGSASPVLTGAGKDWASFEYLYIEPAQGARAMDFAVNTSTNIFFDHCVISSMGTGGYCIKYDVPFGVAVNLTVDNSILSAYGNSAANCISFIHTSGTGADWASGVVVRNSVLIAPGYNPIGYLKSGALANVMGGCTVTGCTIIGTNGITTGNSSLTIPWVLRNNYIMAGDRPVLAQNVAQVDSDYNLYAGGGGNENVTLGGNDKTTACAQHLDLGAARLFGFGNRPALSLMLPSPLQGAGIFDAATTADLNGVARPNPPSIGAFEFYNTHPVGGLGAGTVIVGSP